MRSGGEPTSVLWGDTAAASSLSTPLFSAACSPTPSGAALLLEAMNCFEGPPHHHHLTNIHHHHAHHQPPPVIHLLPPAATPPAAATPGRSPATGVEEDAAPAPGSSTPPRAQPEDGERPATRIDEDAAPEDKGRDERPLSPAGPGATSPHGTSGGHVGSIRVKQEIQEGEEDAKDDSGISPGSGGGAEREVDDDPHLEDSPGGSSRGGIDRGGQGEDGPRSPYSEGCYSEGCEDADLRRLQYSESAGSGPPYSEGDGAGGQRPDAASDEDDAGGDVNKPRITSQGKFKTFRCKQCDFVALTKLEFWEHSRMHIRAERLLTCPRCPFVTEYKHHLEYHLRNHFGSKPFKCPHCPYTCVNKSMLNSHLKSHSSVYQYRCADCGYATKYCHSLKLHLRKYSHQPAMVLHPDGSPNPLPVIDVYGTRRGPKTGSKKVSQQSSNPQEGTAPTSPPSPTTPASTVPATTAVAPTISNTVTTTASSSGHPFQAMVVYPSSQSPSYANGSYFGPASTAPSSAYSTPQTSRPILPRVLQPRAEAEDQWLPTTREDHPEGQAKKAGSQLCVTSNRPVKCTLCEFASTSREAFAEHMMVHAANGDVGNRESGAEAGTNKVLPVNPHHHHHHHHQQQQQHQPSLLMGNGFAPAQAADAGLKEYLARMLTAVVPQIGTFRGPVLPQLQAQWHAHVQQQMQHPHFQQASNGGIVLQQNPTVRRPASPQSIQRPWMNQEAVGQQAQLPRPSGSPSAVIHGGEEEGGEVMVTLTPSVGEEVRGESRRVPNGGVPLDLTKESTPRLQSEYHLGEQKGTASGGSSRRKGRAFKLERISRNLQRGEEEGDGCSSGEDDEERHSRHSDNDEEETSLDSTSKRRKAMATPEEPKAAKVPRNKEDKEDYHCPYCDIAFRDIVLYTMHMGYHGYQDPFKCNMCGQETNDKVSFFLHIARSSHS